MSEMSQTARMVERLREVCTQNMVELELSDDDVSVAVCWKIPEDEVREWTELMLGAAADLEIYERENQQLAQLVKAFCDVRETDQ